MIKKGRGISAVMHPTGFKGGGDPDQATIRLKADGSLDLLVGAVDYGQGAKTVLRQFASEALNLPLDKIALHNAGTDDMPFSTDTAASRVTFIAGNAVIDAAKNFKESVLNYASELLAVPAEELVIDGDKVYKKDDSSVTADFATLGAASNWGGGYIVGNGKYLHCPGQPTDPETGAVEFAAAMAYAVCIVDVEVDTETGFVDIKKISSAYEVGTCVNPLLSEGQIDGGTMMGVGMTMSEDLFPKYPATDMAVDNFTDYIIPTSADIPILKSVIVEMPDANGPYGAKGFGEMSSNPQPPAIVNAIYDAVGIRINSLPATPDKVLAELEAKQQ
ncbi:MAG: xanthine dehydrogenase family protein molybdopterin-binding subunit [Clostridiales bacterium]|nr:xanthine dehydrogenase family protein molybdopterin-binding subunit [Clostridiales bacterium]